MQITDRSKDVIKSGGEWVSSIDLENAAMMHPSVQHAAAIGLPHPKWSERPLLIVVKAPGKDVDADELRQFLSVRLVKWWMPDAIEFVDALAARRHGQGAQARVEGEVRRLQASGERRALLSDAPIIRACRIAPFRSSAAS